jgi:hypothetical protein
MDLLKKVELLLNARSRSVLPRRGRRSALDQQEEEILAEIRQALQDVEAQERVLAGRIKVEREEAEAAARRGDLAEQHTHERRAMELERHLEQESIQALNLEEKLQALEEKLALAKEAVEKQAKEAATRDAEASNILSRGLDRVSAFVSATSQDSASQGEVASQSEAPVNPGDDEQELSNRKSRLAG